MMSKLSLYKGCWINGQAPHMARQMSAREVQSYLLQGGFMLRNTYDFDTADKTSFWYIIKDTFGGMDELSSSTRNCIRRSLKTIEYRRISGDILLRDGGYDVMVAACKSYKVKCSVPSIESFTQRINSLSEEYELWGGYLIEDGRLVVFSINRIANGICEYQTFKCHPLYYRHYYPYYGLIYTMNSYYLSENKLRYVLDGARSITEHSNIQPFLEDKFKFRKAYCRLQIVYKPLFGLVVHCLYPFRQYMPSKVKAILYMEAMKRNEI